MKGIIFNLLEQIVVDAGAEDAWDDLLARAGVVGAYTSLGNYPDQELVALIEMAATARDESASDCLRWFGSEAMGLLAASYPTFFVGHQSLRTFLPTVNDVIHVEVRKLYPGSDTPGLTVEDGDDGDLRLYYASSRQLCALAEGLIAGAAARFGESVAVQQPECMLRGDARCVLVCSFGPKG
jgi:hypothetical protein